MQEENELRRKIATAAMQGILSSINHDDPNGALLCNDGWIATQRIAQESIACADELIKQLAASKVPPTKQ